MPDVCPLPISIACVVFSIVAPPLIVGFVFRTTLPEPVDVVTPVPPAATGNVPAAKAEADVE